MRAGQLKAEAVLEGVDHLLPVRYRRRGFGRDARPHEREGRLQLEELGECHAAARFAPLVQRLGTVPEPDRFCDRKQPVALAYPLGKQVFELDRQGEGRIDPPRHLFRAETFDKVVLRHQPPDARGRGVFRPVLELLVMRVLHLEQSAVTTLDDAGHGHAVACVQLLGDKRLVEPRDAEPAAAVVADARLRQPHPLEFRDLGRDRRNCADHGRLHPDRERGNRHRSAVGLPIERQRQKQVADRLDAELVEALDVGGLHLGQRGNRRVQRVRKDNYAQRVIARTPPQSKPERGSGLSRRLRLTITAIVITVIVVIGIIGYAATGLAYAQTRVGNADKTLSVVISHQNSLNTTVADLNSKFNSLSTSATFDPRQARTLFQQFAAGETAAGVADDQDDASLASSRATLSQRDWLTIVARGSLDKEAAKIDHARKALSIAKAAAAGYAQVGQFFQTYYGVQVDFELVSTQVASADLAGASTTLATMKTDVDNGLQLSSSPGLPTELHALMVDLGTLVTDFGKLLSAAAANHDTAIANAENSVQADAGKLGTYNVDKIMAEITAYYKPMFDTINLEMAKAAA